MFLSSQTLCMVPPPTHPSPPVGCIHPCSNQRTSLLLGYAYLGETWKVYREAKTNTHTFLSFLHSYQGIQLFILQFSALLEISLPF